MSETTPAHVNHVNHPEVFQGHLEAVFSSIKDLIITLDCNWCYTYVNQPMLELSGLKREDFIGKSIWEVFPDAVDTQLFNEMHRAAAAQKPVHFEYLYPAWNQWFECRVYPSENGISLLSTDITARKQAEQRRDVQYAVTRVLAEASTIAAALPALLQALCNSLGWQLAVSWSIDRQNNYLYYGDSWNSLTTHAQALIETNQQMTFAPSVGLPGRVWMQRQPLWISDISKDSNFPRAAAATQAGLQSILGFPILLSNEVLGVIECFGDRVQEPDRDLLNMMAAIGSQIGQFLERKRTEAALQESQQLFQSFMNHSPMAAFIKDDTGRYLFANTWVERVYQRSQSELIGKTDFELLPPKIAQQFHSNDVNVLSSGQPMQVLETIKHEDGEHCYMSFKFPFYNAAGQQLLAGVAIDISEQIQAEATLRKSEERLRIAQQAANAGVWNWDMVTNQVTWSTEYYCLYGLDPASTQPSYENWLDSIIEQDRAIADRAARNALEHRTDLNVEFRILHPTQGERWLTAIGKTFYDDNGQPKRMTGIALDITDRKQAEASLRESEARFETLVCNMPGMVYRYAPGADGTETFTYVSSGAYELLELAPETIIQDANSLWALIHPEDMRSLQQSTAVAVENLLPWEWEGRLITPSGQLKWIQGKSRPEPTEHGVVWDGLLIDITERKQAEEALLKSEERYRKLYDQVIVGISQVDLTGRFIEVNERFCEIVGRSPSQLLTLQMQDITHPDDLPHNIPLFHRMQAEGTSFEIEKRYIRPDGSLVWVRNYVSLIRDAAGRPQYSVAVTEDITERKQAEEAVRQSEERYRYLAESIPQLVWTADATGVIVDINQRWSNFTGLTLAQARTAGWQAVVHPEDLPILGQKWAIAQQKGCDYQAEGRMRRADGTYRWHLHQAVPLKNERGQPLKWFGTATDIEDQKQLEQQRAHLLQQEQAAREQAEAANRIKDEFLAVLSHELRSPLNPILGWAKLLQGRSFDDKTFRKAIETIERNARLQSQLIEDLLDVSRILRGKLSLNMASTSLVPAIESALDTVRLAAKAKQIQIQTYYDSSVGTVLGDSARLQQVIWNLLSNAIKFTPEGGRVEVRLERVEGDEAKFKIQNSKFKNHQSPVTSQQSPVNSHQSTVTQYAQITVRDTGSGIKADFLPYVFDYFRQADGTTTRKFGGLGLGLAIVRHLVELHGGTVWADSPGEGQGATFTVRLPLLRESKTLESASKVNATTDASATLPLTGIKILVVEDEEDNRDFLTFVLEQAGASLTTAVSAYEALQILTQSKPDILISDIGMPEMDGYTLLRQIRKLAASRGDRQIPAIALTAYAGEINQQQALAAGFQEHIPKPVDAEELLKAIMKHLRNDRK